MEVAWPWLRQRAVQWGRTRMARSGTCAFGRPGVAERHHRGFRYGVAHRAQKKPWYYEMSVIFSKEAREERARRVKEEATRGRFAELNEIKENGGKLFEADMDILKLQDPQALPFPDLDVWPLVAAGDGASGSALPISGRLAGKVTLVTVCVRDIARPMVNSWIDAFRASFPQKPAGESRLQVIPPGHLARVPSRAERALGFHHLCDTIAELTDMSRDRPYVSTV